MNVIEEFYDYNIRKKLFEHNNRNMDVSNLRVKYKDVIYTMSEFIVILKERGGVVSDGTLEIFSVGVE